MKKRVISSLLISALIVSAASCGGGGTTSAPVPSTNSAAAEPAGTAAESGTAPSVTGTESAGEKKDIAISHTTPAATASGSESAAAGGSTVGGSAVEAEKPEAPASSGTRTEPAPAAIAAPSAVSTGAAETTAAPVTTPAPAMTAKEMPEEALNAADMVYPEAEEEAYYVDDGFSYDAAYEPTLDAVGDSMYYEESLGDYMESADDYDYSWGDWYRPETQARAGLLTGGEWRDNSNYAFWNSLFRQREDWDNVRYDWKIDTSDRVYVKVTGSDKRPAAGLTVKLASGSTLLWQSVTDSRGEAFLFPHIINDSLTPDHIVVESAGGSWKKDLPKDYNKTDTPFEVTVPETAPMRTQLDLMFMIDTTGSMGDELTYIQTELENVIDRVSDATKTDIQLSVNFYRDEGDDYVVRDYGFTKNISIAIDHLRDQKASGGGDYEEAVEQAIDNALNKHKWRAGSEKLMFLVLDAPPHHSMAVQVMPGLMKEASEMGVRIIPVASSGVDTTTEFLCRCLALTSGGTYTFLTDDSGIGDSHLAPTIGSYEVEKLNDMLVRIIGDYFTQGERTVPSVPSQNDDNSNDDTANMFRAQYRITDDYYSGSGYYTTGVIGSRSEYDKFVKKYGFDFDGAADGVNFNNECIVYQAELLSSGSIKVDDSKGVYVGFDGDEPVFRYSLTRPEVGTTDIKTLFVYAVCPNS